MNVEYIDMKGNSIDISSLRQGTDFKAKVTITHTSAYNLQDMALSQIFPSGWEITTSRLDEDDARYASVPTYQDIRDDRVFTYFNLYRYENNCHCKVFIVKLNASYQGHFYLPSVSCEAMYNASIGARKAGKWIDVVSE